eukprot:1160242-Pelagomonas_calceolata.AAC.3
MQADSSVLASRLTKSSHGLSAAHTVSKQENKPTRGGGLAKGLVGELEVVGCASDFCGGSVVAALSVSIVHFAGVAVPASARAVHYLAASSYCCEKNKLSQRIVYIPYCEPPSRQYNNPRHLPLRPTMPRPKLNTSDSFSFVPNYYVKSGLAQVTSGIFEQSHIGHFAHGTQEDFVVQAPVPMHELTIN